MLDHWLLDGGLSASERGMRFESYARRSLALLLAYYDPDGRLVYAGRAGTGIKQAELERLWRRLQPLSIGTMPRRRVPAASDRRWCSAACIGCGLNWSPRSSF